MFAITPPGGAEWIVIGLIVVLMFGARKLPELGGSVGKSIRNFKKGIAESREDDESADTGEAGEPGASKDRAATGPASEA